ncbi:hypothetical protein [Ferdinandcohnia sp. Marseille-Q9671]
MKEFSWPKLFAFAAFVFIIFTNYDNLQEHKAFLNEAEQHQVEKKVWRKFVVNDLLDGPRFSVQIGALPESTIPTKHNDSMVSISQDLYEQLDAGDTILGFEVDGKFYTDTLLQEEIRWFYIMFVIFSLYPIGYVLYWLYKIRTIRKLFTKFSKRLYLEKVAGFVIPLVVFGGLIVGLLLFLGNDTKLALENGYEKYFGNNHAQTTALVMERGFERRTSTYDRNEYFISLMFKPENKETMYVVKGVTWHTYNKYTKEMPIIYNLDNPYQVFAQDMDFQDYISILMTNTVILTLVSILLLLLAGWIPFLLRKQKKQKSHKDHRY